MRPLPITNRSHTGMELEQIARDCKSSSKARRLRAIAMVMRGAERSEAARAQGVDTQTLRDWIVLYNDGGVEGLRPARCGGRRCRLSAIQLEMVAGWVDAGPEGVEIFYGVNARIWANPVSCSHITFFVGCSLLPPNRKSTGIRTIRTTPTLRGANQSSRTETHTPNPLLPLNLHYSIRNVHPPEVGADVPFTR